MKNTKLNIFKHKLQWLVLLVALLGVSQGVLGETYLMGYNGKWDNTNKFSYNGDVGTFTFTGDGGSYSFTFKIYDDTDGWRANGKTYEMDDSDVLDENGNDMTFKYQAKGTYTFQWNKVSKTLSIICAVSIKGTFNSWSSVELSNGTGSLDITGNESAYEFGIAYGNKFYKDATFTRDNPGPTPMSEDNNDAKITADVTGSYEFSFNKSEKKLTITYPTSCTDPEKPTISGVTVCSESAPAFSFTSSNTAKYKLYTHDGTCVSYDFTNGTGSSITLTANSTITSNTNYYVQATTTVSGCSNTINSSEATATVSSGYITRTDNNSTDFGNKFCGETSNSITYTYSINCSATINSIESNSSDFVVGAWSTSNNILSVPVEFKPNAIGSRSGTITITYNTNNTATLSLSGMGASLYARGGAFSSGWNTATTLSLTTYDNSSKCAYYCSIVFTDDKKFKILTGSNGWDAEYQTLYDASGWTEGNTVGVDGFKIEDTYSGGNPNHRNNSTIGELITPDYEVPAYLYVDVANKKMWVVATTSCNDPDEQEVTTNKSSICVSSSETATISCSAQSGYYYQLAIQNGASWDDVGYPETESSGSVSFSASVAGTYKVYAYSGDHLCETDMSNTVTITDKTPSIEPSTNIKAYMPVTVTGTSNSTWTISTNPSGLGWLSSSSGATTVFKAPYNASNYVVTDNYTNCAVNISVGQDSETCP